MARGTNAKAVSKVKKTAERTQKKLQAGGVSKRSAQSRARVAANKSGKASRPSGTAGGRSKVSKRTLSKATAGKAKSGKTRR